MFSDLRSVAVSASSALPLCICSIEALSRAKTSDAAAARFAEAAQYLLDVLLSVHNALRSLPQVAPVLHSHGYVAPAATQASLRRPSPTERADRSIDRDSSARLVRLLPALVHVYEAPLVRMKRVCTQSA